MRERLAERGHLTTRLQRAGDRRIRDRNESAGPRKVLLIKRRACHMAATDHRFKRLVDLTELRGAPSGKKRVPTIPGAGLGLIPLVETLTLSRTKTQVNPPVAVPDIAKADA